MNFTARTRNLFVAAILAATVAPLTGCAVGTADDIDNEDAIEEVGATEEELAAGQVFAAVNSGRELFMKIDSYRKFGKVVGVNDIYAKVTEVGTSVEALHEEVARLEESMSQLAVTYTVSEAQSWLIDINADAREWKAEAAKGPQALEAYYAKLRPGAYDYIATLEKLAFHAQTAINAQGEHLGAMADRTKAIARANELGVYATGVRLSLTQGYMIIMLAKQGAGETSAPEFFPGGTEFERQNDILAAFDENFFDANDTLNKAIVADEMAWRASMIEQCNKGQDYTIYFKDWAGSTEFPYNTRITDYDNGTALWSNEDTLRASCATFRASYVPPQQARWGAQKMRELLANETAFANWSTPSDAADAEDVAPTIYVGDAKYGSLAVMAHLQSACNNRGTCDYTVKVSELGDIAPGVAKSFTLSYICGNDSTSKKTLTIPAEANGQTVTLSCE